MWFRLLKAVMRIVLVYSTVVVAVLIVYVRYLEPVAARYGFWPKTALALLTILVLSPSSEPLWRRKTIRGNINICGPVKDELDTTHFALAGAFPAGHFLPGVPAGQDL